MLATEQGSKAVEAGVAQSAETGESIRILADSIAEAARAATQIAASAQQQLVGMDQVALAMENIKQASAQNAASTKQAKTSAQNLHELEQKLKQLVAELLETIFREAHSLKGAARAVNLAEIETICQSLEGVFASLQHNQTLAKIIRLAPQGGGYVGRLAVLRCGSAASRGTASRRPNRSRTGSGNARRIGRAREISRADHHPPGNRQRRGSRKQSGGEKVNSRGGGFDHCANTVEEYPGVRGVQRPNGRGRRGCVYVIANGRVRFSGLGRGYAPDGRVRPHGENPGGQESFQLAGGAMKVCILSWAAHSATAPDRLVSRVTPTPLRAVVFYRNLKQW